MLRVRAQARAKLSPRKLAEHRPALHGGLPSSLAALPSWVPNSHAHRCLLAYLSGCTCSVLVSYPLIKEKHLKNTLDSIACEYIPAINWGKKYMQVESCGYPPRHLDCWCMLETRRSPRKQAQDSPWNAAWSSVLAGKGGHLPQLLHHSPLILLTKPTVSSGWFNFAFTTNGYSLKELWMIHLNTTWRSKG